MKCGKVFLIFCTIVFAVTSVTGGALAQDRAKSMVITPSIGGYLFDAGQNINSDPAYGIGLGYNLSERLGIEGVFNYVDTDFKSPGQGADVEAYVYRLDGLYHFILEQDVIPYVAAGVGAITIDSVASSTDTDMLVNYGGGIKFFLTERLALRGDVRHIISFNDTYNNFIYTLGLSYLFGKKKAPPPPPPSDGDGDGVTDDLDKCPGTPEGVSVDSSGCPLDRDGDGVTDDLDKCPGTPEGVSVDSSGCPLDRDGDGVTDDLDKCPGTPEGVSVDSSGCPLDSDGDGVMDDLDKCPGTLAGISVDEKGCPIPIKEKVSIELKVEFDFNSANVKSLYQDHIQKVSNFLQTYPDTTATIEGHTDSKGSDEYNLKLSQRRAENVMKQLIDYGINPTRIKAVGYGEALPIADNSTKEGRQRNRRVVAVISTMITK